MFRTQVYPKPAPTVGNIANTSRLLAPPSREPHRSIRAAEGLAVRHSLPKTRLTRVILNINFCAQRQLDIEVKQVGLRQKRYVTNAEHVRRAFIEKQAMKKRQWRNRDDRLVTSLNFPSLMPDNERSPSVDILYTSPKYALEDDLPNPLLSYQKLRRARTEIVQHKHDIFTTRFPKVIETSQPKLERYKTYCRNDCIEASTRDERFTELDKLLQPQKTASKDRMVKFLQKWKQNAESNRKDKTNKNTAAKPAKARINFPSLIQVNGRKNKTATVEVKLPPRKETISLKSVRELGSGMRTLAEDEDNDEQSTFGDLDNCSTSSPGASREFQSPSHKQAFLVKSSVISGE